MTNSIILACLLALCINAHSQNFTKQELAKYRKAISELKKSSADTLSSDFFYKRGGIRYDYRDYIQSIYDYNRALEADPDNPKICYNRGLALLDMKNYETAMADFTKTIELKAERLDYAYNNRGICKYFMESYNGAIQDYNKAIILAPDSGEAYNNRGISKIKLGLLDEGCADLQKALDLGDKKSAMAIKKYCTQPGK